MSLFHFSTCRYKTLYLWLQLPISSFWAYSIRNTTSTLNEKVYPVHSGLHLSIFSYQLPLTSFTWFPYSILLHAHLVHFTFSYRSFIFSSSCHSALLHSPPLSLHSFQFCLTQQIFIELSSFTRWEFVELVMREQSRVKVEGKGKNWLQEYKLSAQSPSIDFFFYLANPAHSLVFDSTNSQRVNEESSMNICWVKQYGNEWSEWGGEWRRAEWQEDKKIKLR